MNDLIARAALLKLPLNRNTPEAVSREPDILARQKAVGVRRSRRFTNSAFYCTSAVRSARPQLAHLALLVY
jgi:hypothetical protein